MITTPEEADEFDPVVKLQPVREMKYHLIPVTMTTPEERKRLKLKTFTELCALVKNGDDGEILMYIDQLHSALKDYQIVFDMVKQKDKNINT